MSNWRSKFEVKSEKVKVIGKKYDTIEEFNADSKAEYLV